MKNVLAFIIWFIVSMVVISVAFELISLSDSLLNVAGIAICLVLLYVSVETKCFTNIKLKKD